MVSRTPRLRCQDPTCTRTYCYTKCRNSDGSPWCSAKKTKGLTGAALKSKMFKAAKMRATDNANKAIEKLVSLRNRRLRNKTTALELTGTLVQTIRVVVDHTPLRHGGRAANTPAAPIRRQHQPNERLDESTPRASRACSPLRACSSKTIVATLKQFQPTLEEMYGLSTAFALLGRAVALVTAPAAAKALERHSLEALVGASISMAVALEMGLLEWDGVYRSAWVAGSSTRAPYFVAKRTDQRGATEAAHAINMLSCAAFADPRSSSSPSGVRCRCDAGCSSTSQCRCIWLSLAPRVDVVAAEWSLLGVKSML